MANTARITQSVPELITTQDGQARITQDAIEFVTGAGISCGSPPNGTIGIAYSHTFTFGGGTPPYTFAIIAGTLPPGLSLNTATGNVSGTPTTGGTFPFTVQISDIMGTVGSVACSITIVRANQTIAITLYGWKLYPEDPCEPPTEVPEAGHVKRAV